MCSRPVCDHVRVCVCVCVFIMCLCVFIMCTHTHTHTHTHTRVSVCREYVQDRERDLPQQVTKQHSCQEVPRKAPLLDPRKQALLPALLKRVSKGGNDSSAGGRLRHFPFASLTSGIGRLRCVQSYLPNARGDRDDGKVGEAATIAMISVLERRRSRSILGESPMT